MLTPVEQVRATILAACQPLTAVNVPLSEALGAVAAGPVVASADVPPFTNSAMDGYALRAADTVGAPVRLDVVGLLPAGAAPDREVGPRQAIRIMTGAPVPPGADAVVMVERTQALEGGAVVLVETPVRVEENVRLPGSDVPAGTEVLAAGTPLTPALLGLVASVGHRTVSVHRRPVVGVLSTGDELVEGPQPLRPGQIYDANRPMLLALVAEAGCHALDLGCAPDDPAAISAALKGAFAGDCDAALLTGGVSVGDFDFVKDVFQGLGTTRSWHVAMKPGKPLAWGMFDRRPMFGLPGNPVSAAVSFELFARPALRRLAGHREVQRPTLAAVADQDFPRKVDGKLHLVRVVAEPGVDGRLHVRSAGGQDSHMLGALAAGNALALVPDGYGVEAGQPLDVLLLGPG